MNTISVASLKSRLSHFLKLIQKGSEIVITSHHHRIAKLIPYEEKEDLKIISPCRSSRSLSTIEGIKPLKPVDVVSLLRVDRAKR